MCLGASLQNIVTDTEEDAKKLVGNSLYLKVYDDGDYEQRVHLVESWILEKGVWNRYLWLPQWAIYKKEKQPFKAY